MATINTRILLRYDTYENWSKTDVELKGGNFVLKKGEVGFCEVPSDNTAATTAPTVLFKVGDGTNAFKDLKWASALAADVYSWAKENKIIIVKNGTGNVISNIEWDATANNGKGGIKFSTIDVYTKTESDNLYAKKQNIDGGFSAGTGSSAGSGGAIGSGSSAESGGAIGNGAITGSGFAGGQNAKTIDSTSAPIDAIQLGAGTNYIEKSLQIYDYTLMNPDGSIPAERLTNAASPEELERLQYYGDKNIIPSDESYFVVNETGETITGLTDAGKTQTELVIPYEVNGKKITTLYSEVDHMFEPQSILDGSTTITKVTIPKSVTTLGRGVFDHCTSLESINIPDSVKTIDEYAFTYCTSLISIKLPNSITTIGENAFNNCSGLTSIEIANGIKSIGAAMFSSCSNLESIYIPDSITSIGEDAFNSCTSLKRINIPKAVTQLGEFTFDGATNLTIYCEKGAYAESYAEIFNIPVVYTDISKETINNLSSKEELERLNYYGDKNIVPADESYFTVNSTGETITGITVDGENNLFGEIVIPYKINGKLITSITGRQEEDGSTFEIKTYSALYGAGGITKIILPNTITSIGDYAFYECTSLESINMLDSITSVGTMAFVGCTSLKSIEVPAQGVAAFATCTSLETVKLLNNPTIIGTGLFSGCTALKEINIPKSVIEIIDGSFDGITPSQLTVYCEQGSYAETYAKNNGYNIVYTDISNITTTEELERLQYYGDKNIVPADLSYFNITENADGTARITSLTETGKTQTEIVVPYKSSNDNIITSVRLGDGDTLPVTSIVLPNSINRIVSGAFQYCENLTTINIPNSVNEINDGAFESCTSLTSIDIPNSVTTIGNGAFYSCTALEKIKIPNSVTIILASAFNEITPSQLTIYCEQGSYAETYAQDKGFNIVYTDINKDYFNNYVSKDGSNTISGTIDASSGSILVSEPTSDTQAANKKYVDDSITAGIQANDAMTFKGLLGGEGNITELPTDVATVKNGDTYKVAVDGTYNEIAAKSGDMFIALVKNSTVSWQFIPSADDGNVLANNDLTADALIVGNGSKEIKTLDNGSNDQILRIVNNVPAWEKEYEVVASDTSITVTKDTENKQYKVSVNSIEVSKLTQTDGTVLILNGGNSAN